MATQDLAQMLGELRAAGSQLEQLKILVRRWRQLRSLSALERKRLALTMGWDSAEALVDRLGKRGGIAPSTLLKAVRDAERDQPGSLAAIFAGIRTPEGRRDALEKSVQFADRAITSLAPPEPPPPPAPMPQAIPPLPKPLSPAPAEPPPVPDAADADAVVPVETALAAAAPSPEREQKPPAGREKPEKKTRASSPSQPTPAPPDPWARLHSSSTATPPSSVPHERPLATPESTQTSAAALTETNLIQRFRLFREALNDADQDVLLRALNRFPDGWARRRALAYLLESGRISDPQTAADQISSLARPIDRFWCASVWLEASPEPDINLDHLRLHLAPVWLKRLERRFSS